MYLINFVLCISVLLGICGAAFTRFSNLRCRDFAIVTMFHQKLQKTLDKNKTWNDFSFMKKQSCLYAINKTNKSMTAFGPFQKQIFKLRFEGKASNVNDRKR